MHSAKMQLNSKKRLYIPKLHAAYKIGARVEHPRRTQHPSQRRHVPAERFASLPSDERGLLPDQGFDLRPRRQAPPRRVVQLQSDGPTKMFRDEMLRGRRGIAAGRRVVKGGRCRAVGDAETAIQIRRQPHVDRAQPRERDAGKNDE